MTAPDARHGQIAAHIARALRNASPDRAGARVDVAGRVRQVFRTSFNIELAGALVHVGSDEAPLSCLGMRLPAGDVRAAAAGLRPGDVATVRNGRLRVYARTGVLAVDPAALDEVDCTLPGPVAASGIRLVSNLLDGCDLQRRCGLPQGREAACALEALCRRACGPDTVRGGADRCLDDAVAWFLGRGAGLTPAGDDVLIGFGIGLHLRGAAARFDRALARCDLARTAPVSAAYLAAYRVGFANPVARELTRAVERDSAGDAAAAIEAVLGIGHTSGADTLLGLACALDASL